MHIAHKLSIQRIIRIGISTNKGSNSVDVFKVNQIWVPMHECQHLPITIRQVIKWRWLPTMVPGCSFWSKLTLSFECTKVRSLGYDGLCGGLVQQRGPGRGRGGQVGSAADMLTMLDIFQIGEHNTHYKWMFECWILACFLSCGEILWECIIRKEPWCVLTVIF